MGSFFKKASFGLALPFALLSLMAAQAPTTTTLTVSPGDYVAAGTIVKLTATVTDTGAVTRGLVNFCNAAYTVCVPGDGLYGSAQLTSAGTAVFRGSFPYGVDNIVAVFQGTIYDARSSSWTNTLTVEPSPIYASSTTLADAGSAGNYTLSGTITAYGNETLSGSVNFIDTTSGNIQIGSASLSAPQYILGAHIEYPTWQQGGAVFGPYSVAVADFNNDGIPDIVAPEAAAIPETYQYYHDLAVLIGNGDGTFRSPTTNNVPVSPVYVAVGDFNGDGNMDLVTTGGGAQLYVLLGNGDGTFQPPIPTSLPGSGMITVGDFNGDGKLDLAVADYSGTNGGILILLGNGDGTFQPPTNIVSASFPAYLVVGDFNGDGKLDIVYKSSFSQTTGIVLGNGDGTFQSPISLPTSDYIGYMAAGDFNGDGKLDLVVADYSANTVSILLGNGNGTFQSPVPYAAGTHPVEVAVGDFNNDGKLDVAVAGSTNTMSFLYGTGNGSFGAPASYSTGSGPNWLAIADFNGDGLMDIASSDTYDVSVLLQEQTANYTQGGIAAIGTGTQYVDASYAGDATRLASNSSSVPLTGTALLTQTINFSPIASPVTFGVSPIYLSATGGNSGNPVTFSVLSGPGYISGNSLNVTGAGTIVVAANQAGNADYSAAPQVTQAVVVNKSGSGQGYTLSWSTPSNITYGTPLSTTQLDATSTIPGSFAYNYPAGSVLSAGSYVLLATFTPTDSADYNAGTINTTLTVVPATPVLSWAPTPLITYGTPLGPPELNATSNVPGTFVYTPSPGTVLPVGLYELQATFYPTDATDYNSGTVDALLRVATVSTVISVNCAPNPITYGPQTSTCTATVSAGATGNVNFFYNGTPWANNVPIVGGAASATGFSNMPAGSYVVAADYSGDSNFSAASTSTTLTIGQASPAVTLSCYPTSFTLGSTTTCTASVPVSDGTVAFFSTADLTGKWWNAAFPAGGGDLGTTPAATTQDAALNYNISGESWPNAVAGPAGVNTTNVYARWTGTFVSPADGTYTIGVNSDDGANVYVNGTQLVANLSTGQGALSNLTYTQSGQIPLSAGATNTIVVEYEQGGGQAGIQLLWTPPGASGASLLGWTVVPVDADGIASVTGGSPWSAGTYNVNAVYSGDTNYASTSANVVQVTVTQATPTVTVTCSPNTIVFGATASCTAHVSSGTGTVSFTGGASQPGPWVETVDGSGNAVLAGFTNWAAGTYTLQATYSGDNNYNGATGSGTLTITQAAAGLAWTTPAAITYGTPLSATQLDATSGGIAGTFAYTPAAGTVLSAGNQVLSVTFTPTDTTDYSNQTTTVNLLVNKAPLTVTPNPAIRAYGAANPALSGTITGLVAGDDITATYSSAAIATTPVGVYTSGPIGVTDGLSDPNGKLVNYTLTQNTGTFTITQATPILTWATPAPITYGTPLSGVQLNATSNGVAGTFAYTPAAGTILTPGTWPMSVIFTPTDSQDYSVQVAGVSLVVNKAALTITPNPASKVFGAVNPTFTGTVTGLVPGDTIIIGYTSAATQTTPVGVYSTGPNAITYTSAGPVNELGYYNYVASLGTLTITQQSPVLTWATPAAITYGTPLSATQLDASSGGVAGTFAYSPAAGTVLPAGSQTLSVTFTSTDSADYSVQTATVTLLVNKAPLTVTPNPVSRSYGVANPAFTGTITGLVNGDTITATYASSATTSTAVGVYSTGPNAIAATLSDPGNKLPNYSLTQSMGTLTITQATTTLTWATPAAITYGTPLSATQLDATSGGVAGTFVYTPAAGTVLPAGSQLLSVTFTPTDGADYSAANATVTLTVNKAPLTVTPNPASKVYGAANPAFTGSITGLVAGDTITATYASGATTTTPVGVYSSGVNAIAATLSDPGNKLGNYTLTQSVGTLTITQATTVLTWSNPAPIAYGTPLGSTQLNATSGGVAGTFVYTPPAGTVLPAGSQSLSVTFTPTETADYSSQNATVTLTVNKAPLSVTPTAASRLYDVANPAFTGTLTGVIPGDGITATYSSGATLTTPVGVYSTGANAIAATLADPNNKLANYSVTQNLGALTITQATPTLTWNTPAAIAYGTALSAVQLNATSGGVAGTFAYTPAAGTVLGAGSHTLNVTFTPTDGVDYGPASASVTLTVNPASLTVTPSPASKIYGTANPVFSGSITGMIPGDGITATYASAATTSTTVGVYSSGPDAVAATLSDPGNKLGNYTVNQSLGTLTITQATTVLTWATPAAITYGTPLGATQLDATSGGVVGTFTYTPTSGTILPAGTQILSLAFTPSDTVDYSSANTTTSLTINKATPTVTLTSSTNPTVYGSPVTFTAQTAVSATGTITFYDGATIIGTGTLSSGTATFTLNSLGAGTHSITASYGGDSNYLSAVSAAVSQVVTKSPVNITVTSSQNPSNYGQSVTFTFTVTGVPGLAIPSGSIAFSDGSTPLASPTLNGSGVATYTTVMLTDGSHSLTAVYGGDANYQ